MKEYCIYVRKGNGSPYILKEYNSIYAAKDALYNMLSFYETRKRIYFVDNDFFDNPYPEVAASDYYCIKERNITDWVTYKEIKTVDKNKMLKFKKPIDILF
jgi:hypothetical protein